MHTRMHTKTCTDIYVYARTHSRQQTHLHKHRQMWACARMYKTTNKEANLSKPFKWGCK